jgi:hypothetical protein
MQHTVIDKYERAPDVINEDVSHWSSEKRYDYIVSISTLEHVGWDKSGERKEEADGGKILAAIETVKQQLAPGGTAIITVPIGYNPFLDPYLADNTISFAAMLWMTRTGLFTWEQTGRHEALNCRYNSPFRCANAILIGVITP